MSVLILILSLLIAHDIHISNARVSIQPSSASMRIRFFRNDLENALARNARKARFDLARTPEVDAAFLRYLNRNFSLKSGPETWRVTLMGSGEEKGARPELDIWYYDVTFAGRSPARQIEIRNELLFDLFRDQTNIMKLQLPSGGEKTVMFVHGDGRYRLKL